MSKRLPARTARELNALAESRCRVQCSKGHWTAARLVLAADFETRVIAAGEVCATCREPLS